MARGLSCSVACGTFRTRVRTRVPALAGGFLTNVTAGKSRAVISIKNSFHCCFCCAHPCTMLGVSLFISCKNKIQCVCVCEKKKNSFSGLLVLRSQSGNMWLIHFSPSALEVGSGDGRDSGAMYSPPWVLLSSEPMCLH